MKKSARAKASHYSHRDWLDRLEVAEPSDRSELAIKWLSAYVTSLDNTRAARNAILQKDFPRDMRILRKLAQYVPNGHAYFRRREGGIEHMFNMGRSLASSLITESTRAWDGDYPVEVETTKEHATRWATESLVLTRDLWLERDKNVRRDVLLSLASDIELFARQSHHSGAPELMCEAAWDAASEAGMPEDMVAAATRLSLWSARSHTGIVARGNNIRGAINVLFRRCLLGAGSHPNSTPAPEVKDTMVANPVACAITLLFVTQTTHLATSYIYPGVDDTPGAFDSLYGWLPTYKSMLELSNHLGLSPLEALEQIVSSIGSTTPSMELPLEVSVTADV
jgi:hypothetical protein